MYLIYFHFLIYLFNLKSLNQIKYKMMIINETYF